VKARTLAATAVAALAWAATAAGNPSSLRSELASALAGAGVSPAGTSALAVDLRSGRVVYALNPRLAVAPASNEKLTVAYAALERLGRGYRFRTEVMGDGELAGRVWRGDLYLVGFGDPSLRAAGLDALAAQVRAWGIRRVTGAVVGDESWFDRRRDVRGWKQGFLGEESPPLSALVVEHAESWPSLEPALEAAQRFRGALERRGVRVAGRARMGGAPRDGVPLAQHLSAELHELIRFMNRESDNFTAEMLLKHLGATVGARGSTAAGAAVVRAALAEAGVPLDGLVLADGSGLSRLDRLSAASLVALLRAAERDPDQRDAFLGSLAVAGVDGTLERRLARRPTYGRVIAKTGTTSLASSLAGFVRGRYAFAILHSGRPVPTWTARTAQDRFVTVLARAASGPDR
jgi:D-alanyl-D-alanine carboxypeptidase/D-alanyl-D-alanine-endopeptidase (penicillin-binding protein 4)